MPYHFFKPIQRGLIKMAAKNDVDIVPLIQTIVRERLAQEGYLKDPKSCLHEQVYEGKSFYICDGCGVILGETESDVEKAQRQARAHLTPDEGGFDPDKALGKFSAKHGGRK